jgi:hypothetical protein
MEAIPRSSTDGTPRSPLRPAIRAVTSGEADCVAISSSAVLQNNRTESFSLME